jgi:PAS domain-containing protein
MPNLPRRLLAAHGSNFCPMSKPQRGATESPISDTCNIDNRFRVIFDAVNDGIFIVNSGTGRFIEVNQTGCDLFGYNKSELIGRDIETLSSGDHPYTQDIAMAQKGKFGPATSL